MAGVRLALGGSAVGVGRSALPTIEDDGGPMGRKFSVIGDSISTFAGCNPAGYHVFYEGERCVRSGVERPDDTWWAQVVRHFGGEVLSVGAFSGSMVEGAGFPAACSPERAAALAGPRGEAPDTVIAFIGINDYGWGGAAAQAAGRSRAMPACLDADAVPEAVAGAAPADAARNFGDAYRTMLERIRAAYPAAQVYCCTLLPGRPHDAAGPVFAYRLRGVHLDEYNNAIRETARAAGCRVADVRALGRDYDSLEGTHPTALGMRQFAAMVAYAMERADAQAEGEAAAEPLGADAFFGAPRSEETCSRASCIGCEYAANTGNQWLCVCRKPCS